MISSESKKGKKLHIEFLRFFCIWLVMFTHTSTAGFSLYLLRPESFFFPFYIAVPFWVKTAVPIFFMISGALLLKKEEPISVIFKKRIWRFAQIIFIFSLINYLYFYHGLNLSFFGHLSKFFTLMYSSNMATAYYFLYIYIGFLLMLPLWRILVRHMTNQLFLYLIALNLFFVGFIPVFSFLIFKGTADINWFINPILAVSEPSFYFILGYWIENVLPIHWLTKRNLLYLGMAAIAGTMITHNISERWQKILLFLGSMSFGVMLFEEITRNITRFFFNRILLTYIPRFPFFDAVIWICSAFILGLLLTYLVKKIPYFAHLI